MVYSTLKNELSHFRELTPIAQRLLISYGLFQIVAPLITLFTNAYLWRQSNDSSLVALYNVAAFVALPISFFTTGILLRYFSRVRLFWVGCLAQIAATVLLMFFPSSNYLGIVFYGFIAGFGSGLYWPILSMLVMKSTTSKNRLYFTAIQTSSSMIIGILVPVILGNIIAFGDTTHYYQSEDAYRVLTLVSILILFIAGYVIQKFKLPPKAPKAIIMVRPSKRWIYMRWYRIFEGLVNGIVLFVPSVMVLYLVGNEDILGSLQSLSAIVGAVVIYFVGRWANVSHRVIVIAIGMGVYILGGLGILAFYSQTGVIIYLIAQTIYGPLKQTGFSSISMDIVDEEKSTNHYDRYQFIFDQELFLNIGRIIGTAIFIAVTVYLSLDVTLRFMPLGLAFIQLTLIYFAHMMDKTSHRHIDTAAFVPFVDRSGQPSVEPLREE